jgi:hypothetical protein
MAIGTLAIAEPIPHRPLTAPEALVEVTGRACQLLVLAFQGIGRDLCVVERLDLERVRDVASVTLALRRSESKLTGVNVAVASRTFAGRTPVCRAPPARPILRRW